MRKNIFVLLIVVLGLSGCVIKDGRDNEVTPGKLAEYGEFMLAVNLNQPAYELAALLFIDEYMDADEETRADMMKQYNASGKIDILGESYFDVSYFGQVATGMRPLAENGWNTGWTLSSDGKTWTNKKGVEIEPIYDDEGFLGKLAVKYEGVVEERLDVKTSVSCPDGPFVFSNPLLVDSVDKLFYCYAFGNSLGDSGITCRGKFRVDICSDSETIDWVVLSGVGSKTLNAKTSRD